MFLARLLLVRVEDHVSGATPVFGEAISGVAPDPHVAASDKDSDQGKPNEAPSELARCVEYSCLVLHVRL